MRVNNWLSAFLKRKTWYVNFKDGVGRRRTIATRQGRKPKCGKSRLISSTKLLASGSDLSNTHPTAWMPSGGGSGSGRLDVDLQLNAGCVELRLHRELDENCLGVTENSCPPCARALAPYATAPLLGCRRGGSRETPKRFGEILQRVLVGLTVWIGTRRRR